MNRRHLPVVLITPLAVVLASAGSAGAVTTAIARWSFNTPVAGGATVYPNGAPVADAIPAPSNEVGTVAVSGSTPTLLSQVPSPLTGQGMALAFGTAGCSTIAPITCSKLGSVTLTDPAMALTPSTRSFQYGATLELTATPDPAAGMNVIQKGLTASTSMWKLQADGGHISCVFKFDGDTANRVIKVGANPALAVNHIYRILCSRKGTSLSTRMVELDPAGTVVRTFATGTCGTAGQGSCPTATASITVTSTARIGNKGTTTNPDQLSNAILDNVLYTLL